MGAQSPECIVSISGFGAAAAPFTASTVDGCRRHGKLLQFRHGTAISAVRLLSIVWRANSSQPPCHSSDSQICLKRFVQIFQPVGCPPFPLDLLNPPISVHL